MLFKTRKNQKGQAVLIVLLSLSVVLIIVMYILSRSITDISLSSKEEDSMRAFSAAEAGIERALVIGTGGSGNFDDANFNADVTSFGSGVDKVVYPLNLKSGDTATFWFSRVSDPTSFTGNQIKLCWGQPSTSSSTSETPAIELSVFYKTITNQYQVARATLDPNVARTTTNNFTQANSNPCTIGDESFQFENTISFQAAGLNIPNYGTAGVLQYATVKVLYNTTTGHKVGLDTSVATSGTELLPSQGIKVDSQGSFADANRRIEVYQLNSEVPPIFANVIYSSGGIVK